MGYLALLLFIPIQNFVTQISQYILNKKVQSKLIPKMEIHEIPLKKKLCIIVTKVYIMRWRTEEYFRFKN